MPSPEQKISCQEYIDKPRKYKLFSGSLEVLSILLPALGTDSYSVGVPHLRVLSSGAASCQVNEFSTAHLGPEFGNTLREYDTKLSSRKVSFKVSGTFRKFYWHLFVFQFLGFFLNNPRVHRQTVKKSSMLLAKMNLTAIHFPFASDSLLTTTFPLHNEAITWALMEG